MNNTPLNADDDELDKAAQLLGIYLEEIDVDGYIPINVNRQTLTHILADRKKHELQARLSQLDALININDKTFNRWSQRDIANFFNTVGKRYRALEQELEKL